MRRLELLAALVATVAGTGCAHRSPAVVVGPPTLAWVEAATPRCGEVIGRVIRRRIEIDSAPVTAAPLPGVSLSVDTSAAGQPSSPRSQLQLVTDATGLFTVRLLKSRPTVIELRGVGYAVTSVAIDGRRYRAAAVEITLGSVAFDVPLQGISVVASRGADTCAQ